MNSTVASCAFKLSHSILWSVLADSMNRMDISAMYGTTVLPHYYEIVLNPTQTRKN